MTQKQITIIAIAMTLLIILAAAFIYRPGLFYYTGLSFQHCLLIYAVNAPTAHQADMAAAACSQLH